jgi:hypothetical protein
VNPGLEDFQQLDLHELGLFKGQYQRCHAMCRFLAVMTFPEVAYGLKMG